MCERGRRRCFCYYFNHLSDGACVSACVCKYRNIHLYILYENDCVIVWFVCMFRDSDQATHPIFIENVRKHLEFTPKKRFVFTRSECVFARVLLNTHRMIAAPSFHVISEEFSNEILA